LAERDTDSYAQQHSNANGAPVGDAASKGSLQTGTHKFWMLDLARVAQDHFKHKCIKPHQTCGSAADAFPSVQ